MKKETNILEYGLKGNLVSVEDDGMVKVEIVKPNITEADQENINDIAKQLLDFCTRNLEETIEIKISAKLIQD
ncbi:hypothetical protein [Clostridium tagluense]|uniref:Uncharacterized protein n=1 Tax=Clostridium tagluense TaxID=360422 RepID=A0A401ULL6_9CLOT|nr:hypothetical protein [Clostridium tagluense]GCD10419.1 hypothetical protein Ctaglu_20420 [Clostridium tagluense]